tara:strand:- start:2248 stop:3855 length:1608 start_codon:yes stop_codon:yes gene_type:complete
MRKVITKIVFFIFFLNKSILQSQIPTELNHLSNIIAKRLAVRLEIDLKYFDQNYISSVDLNKLFANQDKALIMRSIWDINIPNQDTSEFFSKKKNQLFSRFDALKNKNLKIKKDYLLKLNSDSTLLWMSFKENFLFQPIRNSDEYLFNDKFTITGIIGQKLFINSTFSMSRHTGNQIWISNDYQGEWTKYFDEINTTFWYRNHTSLYLKGELFDIEMSNRPFSWGWSSGNSPLISANAIPFNHFSILKKSEKFNFEYFHGSLNKKSIDEIHTDNKKLEKFIAGHRLQYKPTNNFKFSISEIVVYGDRSPELGYLNPISFFWAQEHNLGDLDNILLSFDFGYILFPGAILYNTLVLDELSWKDLFSDWWGNKYSYQFGMFFSSLNMKLPDFRLEYTATRPWTFTHPDFSFSNRNVSIGAVNGPSSTSLRAESFYTPSPNIMAQFSFEKIHKGIGLGSNIHDNYDNRNKENDLNTEFLLDQNFSKYIMEIHLHLYLTNMIKIISTFRTTQLDNPYAYYSENQSEKNEEFIMGIDFNW